MTRAASASRTAGGQGTMALTTSSSVLRSAVS